MHEIAPLPSPSCKEAVPSPPYAQASLGRSDVQGMATPAPEDGSVELLSSSPWAISLLKRPEDLTDLLWRSSPWSRALVALHQGQPWPAQPGAVTAGHGDTDGHSPTNGQAACPACPQPWWWQWVGLSWPTGAGMRFSRRTARCHGPCFPNPQGDAGTGWSHPRYLLPGMVVLWEKQPGSKTLGKLEVWWDLSRGTKGRGWCSCQHTLMAEAVLGPLWLWEGCDTPAPDLAL